MVSNFKDSSDFESFQNWKIHSLKKKPFIFIHKNILLLQPASPDPLLFLIKWKYAWQISVFQRQSYKSKYVSLNCEFGALTSDVKNSILESTKQVSDTKTP